MDKSFRRRQGGASSRSSGGLVASESGRKGNLSGGAGGFIGGNGRFGMLLARLPGGPATVLLLGSILGVCITVAFMRATEGRGSGAANVTPETLDTPGIPRSTLPEVSLETLSRANDAWWLEDEQDDFYEREYIPKSALHQLRHFDRKQFFTGMCGNFRFNVSAMPDVSVIVTVQNEQDLMLSLTVHSILGRTPPTLLKEIIIVDDNGTGDLRAGVNETEFEELLTMSKKIKILKNNKREGCARSRMRGADAATGEVLMFVDSHIEMMSSTWLQHLLIPIMENPRTMALQTLDIISDLDHSYGDGSGDLLYGIITDSFFFGYQKTRFHGEETEKPSRRMPYETPFGPGSLFAIRRDEFFRLGAYDRGLYVWGGENTELAFKIWMCGGRMVMVPCSRVGHMYRVHMKEVGRWPPEIPQDLTDRLGCGHPGEFIVHGGHADNFTKIITRNNMRIMEAWVGDHEAKAGYYKKSFGTDVLPPEWQQFVDEMKNDPTWHEQKALKERNKCKDFAWFERHVYMKYVGVHHPWHPSVVQGGKTWV